MAQEFPFNLKPFTPAESQTLFERLASRWTVETISTVAGQLDFEPTEPRSPIDRSFVYTMFYLTVPLSGDPSLRTIYGASQAEQAAFMDVVGEYLTALGYIETVEGEDHTSDPKVWISFEYAGDPRLIIVELWYNLEQEAK